MATPPHHEFNDWFVLPSGHSVTFLFVQISESYDQCLPWVLGVQKWASTWFDCWYSFSSKNQFWVLMLASSYLWLWFIKIYCGPPWSTCIIFIFLSVLSFSNVCYLMFMFQTTACLILQSDLKIVENLSHFDITLLQVTFRNIFVFLDIICWHARRDMILVSPRTPVCWNGLRAWRILCKPHAD